MAGGKAELSSPIADGRNQTTADGQDSNRGPGAKFVTTPRATVVPSALKIGDGPREPSTGSHKSDDNVIIPRWDDLLKSKVIELPPVKGVKFTKRPFQSSPPSPKASVTFGSFGDSYPRRAAYLCIQKWAERQVSFQLSGVTD